MTARTVHRKIVKRVFTIGPLEIAIDLHSTIGLRNVRVQYSGGQISMIQPHLGEGYAHLITDRVEQFGEKVISSRRVDSPRQIDVPSVE